MIFLSNSKAFVQLTSLPKSFKIETVSLKDLLGVSKEYGPVAVHLVFEVVALVPPPCERVRVRRGVRGRGRV